MNGARMRSNSLRGTRPPSTRASVPLLSAPNSARTRTSCGRGCCSVSCRISAFPRAVYQSAWAALVVPSFVTITESSDWTIKNVLVLYHQVRTARRRIEVVNRVLERSLPQSTKIYVTGREMTRRRALFALLFAATMVGSLALAAFALSPGGLDAVDIVLLVLFAITLPWMIAGLWNAVIGFLIMRFSRDPIAAVVPEAALIRGDEPIIASTAIVLCIRNEAPERIVRNLEPMLAGLESSGFAHRFHLYVLSDTNDPSMATVEEGRIGELAARWKDRVGTNYRRRTVNTGYKAGNIRDFCDRWGGDHELAVTLDADSFMTADAILRLVRLMQANPRLGILQGLVVGLPSTSAFARIFQFGMRLGMRSYTIGSAWWQSDCGPYWGHNAVLRLKPFIGYCDLPVLKDGEAERHILSHDQIEAAL